MGRPPHAVTLRQDDLIVLLLGEYRDHILQLHGTAHLRRCCTDGVRYDASEDIQASGNTVEDVQRLHVLDGALYLSATPLDLISMSMRQRIQVIKKMNFCIKYLICVYF